MMARLVEILNSTAHFGTWWKIRRMRVLSCGLCRPHHGHDKRSARRTRSDAYKSHRRNFGTGSKHDIEFED